MRNSYCYIDNRLKKLENKNINDFQRINLSDYLDSSLIRYLIELYIKHEKECPMLIKGYRYKIKSLYVDFDELLDIQDFLIEVRKKQKRYSNVFSKLYRRIEYVIQVKG